MDNELVQRFIAFGLAYAEINEYLSKEFYNECFSSCSIHHHAMPKKIIIRLMPPTKDVAPVSKPRLRQVSLLIAKRLGIEEHELQVFIELVKNKNLCPQIHAFLIAQKLSNNFPVRRAVYASLKQISEHAQGVQIIISGKTKGQRAKSLKFKDGIVLHTGYPAKQYMKHGFASVKLRQGVLGIKVSIVLKYDENGIEGPDKEMPDKIVIFEPKDN